MNNDVITLSSSSQARTDAQTLLNDAVYYGDLCNELLEAKTQIQANWEGDSADINDIVTRIDSVVAVFKNKITGIMDALATEVIALAEETDRISQTRVEDGPASADGDGAGTGSGSADGEAATTTEAANEKPGFWAYHGQDFADDWNFSGCDSGLDYVGAALGGVCGTVGSVVNFVVDGASEILGWLFG